jgi:aminopeptidase N
MVMSYCRTAVASILLLLSFLLQTGHSAAPAAPEYELSVSFDIARGKVAGVSKMSVVKGEPVAFGVAGLDILSVRLNQRTATFQAADGNLTVRPEQSGILEIRYEGVFAHATGAAISRDSDVANVIGREGIFLASAWYPQPQRLAQYHLKALLPRGYIAVSEAEKIQRVDGRDGATFVFSFDHPVDKISLVASDRYQVRRDHFHGVELSAYFFSEDQGLAAKYLDYTKKYIELYDRLLVPFPFKRFAVVENFLPTGYSMPTYTLLGQEVVRLPFIVETSLGHEILHQWFGNDLYIDESKGNWAEGLTTYLADHWYLEQKGQGWRYRKQILIDYANYVNDQNEFAPKNFTQRFDAASRSIGYGKVAMVFHMLRRRLGDQAFFAGLRRLLRQKQFQRVSWDDFRAVFQRQTGKKLAPFFDQWLERKGLAALRPSHISVAPVGGAFVLSFDLAQAGEVYNLDVPVKVVYQSGGEKTARIALAERNKHVRMELKKKPAQLIIDENYDIARRLAPAESPPVIAGVLGAEKLRVVAPEKDESKYKSIIEFFHAKGAQVVASQSLDDAALGATTLLLLGHDNAVARRLYGEVESPAAGFSLVVKKNPRNPLKAVGIVVSTSADETRTAWPKILHYGKYSALTFQNGRNLSATIAETARGMREIPSDDPTPSVKDDPPAVDVSTLKKLSDVVRGVAHKRIVYVGEQHDQFAHHQVQLEILQGLYRQNPKIAVGMEMFQRPFQKALDDYIAGAIDERTFLKRSEYFKRWDIDYHLYKPILDFARAKRLPVIALNVRRELVEKVGKTGFDSLTEEEKREVPAEQDYSDTEYRERLKEAFAGHQHDVSGKFEFFYQAQILWDETMADSVERFMKTNPDYRMIVLAGAGHIQYGSGIPKRVYRKDRLEYAIVLNDADVDKQIADYIVFPKPVQAPAAPKLMVLVEDRDQTVRIKGFVANSVSEKAGLKVQDAIVALDGRPVNSLADVKIALFFKHAGDSIAVTVRRMNASPKPEDLEFNVKLQ